MKKRKKKRATSNRGVKSLPKEWLGEDAERTIATAAQIELSGGMIVNIVRQAAILLAGRKIGHVNSKVLASLIEKIQS